MKAFTKGRNVKKGYIAVAVVLALAIFGAGAYLLWLVNPKSPTTQKQEGPVELRSPFEIKADTISEQAEKSNTPDAVKKADTELKQLASAAKSDDEAMVYYGARMNIYAAKGDYKTALASALEAESDLQSAQTAGAVAAYYSELGNHAESVSYYRLAMSRSEKVTDPKLNVPYNNYRLHAMEEEAQS